MNIVLYNPEFRNAWNNFLIDAKNATFLFNRSFIEYHSDRFRDHSLIVLDENSKIEALLPANVTDENTLISHQGLTYGGLVYGKEEKLNKVLHYFREILAYLNQSGIDLFYYKELPHFYNDVPSEEQQYALFLLNAKLYRRDTAIAVKYTHKIPYQKRRMRAIKAAEKHGVLVSEEKTFDLFWDTVLTPNLLKRFNVKPVHSLDEIKLLHTYFPDSIRQFNAYLNGELMAGTTIFETPVVAHAQYISASDEGRRNGSLDFLFYHLIENVFAHKSFFDFGICNEDNGRKINQGLLDWKEGFGGQSYSHNFYEVNTSSYECLDNLFI